MEKYTFRKWYIPDRMMPGIQRYIQDHIRPGGFLQAVISNNLKDAVSLGDDENIENLTAFVMYFHHKAPSACWGSQLNMERWLQKP